MLSTGSFNFIPYSLSGLQNISADTINGQTPFNGVIANPNYPLSYNSTTGILSQSPIGQSVETSATPTFNGITSQTSTDLTLKATTSSNNINLNIGLTNIAKITNSGLTLNGALTTSGAITTATGTLNIRPAGFTTRFNNDGVKGFVEVECVGTSTTGQLLFYLANGTLQALMRADTSYFYFFNLNALAGCVYYTKGGVVFYCSYGQATGTGEIVFKDNNIEVFTANAVNGLTMKNSNRIQSVAGTNLILNAPTGQQINFNINNTTKFYVNSSGIYAISLPSSTQTYILGYNTTTGQITYQSPPTVPLSITVNNITSSSPNNLVLDTAGSVAIMFNIAGSNVGYVGTNGLYINDIWSKTPISNLNLTSQYDIVLNTLYGTQSIYFNINSANIGSVNSSGLIIDYITSKTGAGLTLDGDLGIDFNVNGTTYGQMTTTGLLVNNVGSIGGMDLSLSSITGLITTGSSFSMYGGNLNLLDYATGLIMSQLFTNSLGLNITSPIDITFKTTSSTNKINFNVGTSTIAYINSTGMTLETNLNINSSSSTTASIILINAVSAPKIQSTSSLILQSSTSGSVNINNGTATIASFGTTSLNMTANIEMTLGNILISYGYYQQFLTSSISVKWKFKPSGTAMQVANSSGVGCEITNGATSWTAISDIRLKKNIQPLKNSLDLINKLNPITYNWKDETLNNNNIGFIAQEVQEVLPEITEDYDIEDEKYLGIRTTDLIPFLVKSIQEQSALFEEQKVQLLNQNKILVELSKELKDLKEILKNHNLI